MTRHSAPLMFAGLAGAALLGACATAGEPAKKADAMVALKTPAGAAAGEGWVKATASGLELKVKAQGMPAGVHGIHVHTTGKCDAPDFQTAGGHWNPTSKEHGHDNPAGAHTGDLPNITIDAAGKGALTITLAGATLDGLFDADGSALVLHATADDYKTDPSGNSGARIACGVFTR